jgi:hypothetical protein
MIIIITRSNGCSQAHDCFVSYSQAYEIASLLSYFFMVSYPDISGQVPD